MGMIIFRALIFVGAVVFVFVIVWRLVGRRAAESLFPEDRSHPDTLDEMKTRALELQLRKAELYAKKKALEDAHKRLEVTQEAVGVTEEIAQTDIRIKKTEDRLTSLDRVIEQQLHTQ